MCTTIHGSYRCTDPIVGEKIAHGMLTRQSSGQHVAHFGKKVFKKHRSYLKLFLLIYISTMVFFSVRI